MHPDSLEIWLRGFFLIQVHKYSCFPAGKNPLLLAGLHQGLVVDWPLLSLPMAVGKPPGSQGFSYTHPPNAALSPKGEAAP